jgi:hypothetical protein
MINVEKLLSIASDPLVREAARFPDLLQKYELGQELFELLQRKNGFYAFESALHIFPVGNNDPGSLESWNSETLWRSAYKDLAAGLLFFAEDILQDQFCLSQQSRGVFRFKAETGRTSLMAQSIDQWAAVILGDYRIETAWPLAHEWREKNGPIVRGKRLMPKRPFFLGGKYALENLWLGDAVEGMRFKAHLALETRDLPDGAKVELHVGVDPQRFRN